MSTAKHPENYMVNVSDSADHAIGFATRTRPLTYDELWEWCRRSPYFTSMAGAERTRSNPRGHGRLLLIHRDHELLGGDPPAIADGADALRFPLMVARAVAAALGWPR